MKHDVKTEAESTPGGGEDNRFRPIRKKSAEDVKIGEQSSRHWRRETRTEARPHRAGKVKNIKLKTEP